ncbi:MAG: glycosyltransferase [Myxococcales bacterium]|nr:glycosyltransferase [Myxococcales bacterium]MCB9521484.1 glycosyltransferase [Myxococcales bacterium]MCB9531766.1 glycosyltransferase [Myxococcales bacterium]
MRRFLYITPYFPPQSRVGALRPLKFARHLPALGWEPVVLADLLPADAMDATLFDAVPAGLEVRFDYSAKAARTFGAFRAGELPAPPSSSPAKRPSRLAAWVERNTSPEWIPLGEHSVDIPHAVAAAKRALTEVAGCEAIVVNADPYAALIVGRRVAAATGLPLIGDLRDPWGPCELRRPQRPAPQRAAVDRIERWVIDGCARYVVNTETARAAYIALYPDVPPERFVVIRNHGDADLIGAGEFPRGDRFRILFMGNFRRFVEGTQLLEALAKLPALGVSLERVELVVTGRVPEDVRTLADSLGVGEALVSAPFVPYRQVGPYLETADLLVSLSNATDQRIPAKLFDYATSTRPILIVADSVELGDIAKQLGGAELVGLTDVDGIARAFARSVASGRERVIPREHAGLDSATAAGALAAVLEEATSGG